MVHFSLWRFAYITFATIVASQSQRSGLPSKCLIAARDREECGYPGIPIDYCLGRGCCFDDSAANTKWCYKASTDLRLTKGAIFLLARDGVPFEVIASLYADTVPGAEWLMAFKDGKLDTTRLLQIIADQTNLQLHIDPVVGHLLAGNNPLELVINRLAAATGRDPTFIGLLIDGNSKAILNHIIAITLAKRKQTFVSPEILNQILSGDAAVGARLVAQYADLVFPYSATDNPYRVAFFRALASGKVKEAIQWSYLTALLDKYPAESFYPPNAGVLANIIGTSASNTVPFHPLGLRKGLHAGKTFTDVFGEAAAGYVCNSHPSYLLFSCQGLLGKLIVSNDDCASAGCCLRDIFNNGTLEKTICFENYFGNIGLALANTNDTTEDFGAFYNYASTAFVPWVPNNELPVTFQNFISSEKTNPFENFYPTNMPLQASKLRPNFVWKPHGPTAFPFPTRLPNRFLAPTDMSKIVNEPEKLPALTNFQDFGDCSGVAPESRFPCMENVAAFSPGGKDKCRGSGCCFQPDWRNISVIACFRKEIYGECAGLQPSEKIECGYSGINQSACLTNKQCCYDSAVSVQSQYDQVPWCYYKRRAPIREEGRCLRFVPHLQRRGCFSNYQLNYVVSQQSCTAVRGCCYEKVKQKWFDRVVRKTERPPPCFKGAVIDLTPTTPPTFPPLTIPVCQYLNELPVHFRTECDPDRTLGWFGCVKKGCCFEATPHLPGYPWCFQKSFVPL